MSDWDDAAPGWDDSPAVRLYADAALASLEAEAARRQIDLTNAAVLDFGCGTGLLTERLVDRSASIVAFDVSVAMLDVLRAKIDASGWGHVSARQTIPDRTESFDVIVCSSVLGFVDDYPSTVAGLAERLRPGGLFAQWDWEADPHDESDQHGLTTAEIYDTLTAVGLVTVHVDTAFTVDVDGESMAPLIGSATRPQAPVT